MLKIHKRLSTLATKLDKNAYKPVIGLEVHVQLNTKTKLFSRAPNGEKSPNQLVSAFDMATPGILPMLNKKCVMHALKMGFLLNCEIPSTSRFDRKHYFYADMPAGYQITQNEKPIAKNGKFGFYVFGENVEPYWKEINIIQLQLEQDSGKTINIENQSLIDYNRAGCALVEVVTSPCFSTALEAICFVQHLRLILINYNICDGELHKGQIRVDANVSLSFNENEGVRTEIKNMNSIRHIHSAINYEISRQFDLLINGEKVINETRTVDGAGKTVSMRDKEQETDYRFMVEPNLPTLVISQEMLENCKEEIKKIEKPKFEWLRDDIGFDPRSAIHISDDLSLLNFVEKCVKYRKNGLKASSLLTWMKELKIILQRSKEVYPPQSNFFIQQFMILIEFYEKNQLTKLKMLELLRRYANNEELLSADELIEKNQYWKISDEDSIKEIVKKTIEENAEMAEKAKKGNLKNLNKIRNLIIQRSNKCIEVNEIERILKVFIKKTFNSEEKISDREQQNERNKIR